MSCYLRNYMVECQKIFTRVLTDYGFCYTFNMKGYNTVFNEDEISSEFDSYKDIKISEIVDLDNGYISYATRPGEWFLIGFFRVCSHISLHKKWSF